MAAGYLQQPGSEFGPCTKACEHNACKATREIAITLCPLCGKEIGYDTAYYHDDTYDFCHAVCLETLVEIERDSRKANHHER